MLEEATRTRLNLRSLAQGPRQWRRPGLDGSNLADPQTGFSALGTPRWSAPVDESAAVSTAARPPMLFEG